MSEHAAPTSHGPSDAAIVVVFAAAMAGLVVVISVVGLLLSLWATQAKPSMRPAEMPVFVEPSH